ncbi:hypothetical protein [Streptomyces lydicus]|uniref:hypothetical protein n=1 Tax=Streptomyces lydicus TaxID=47763 RepID=UPI0013E8FAC3|nr:hypothetical protein [Streptomyces lydicus]
MDIGTDCGLCGDLVAYRRGLRRRLAARADADLPGASVQVRRALTEQRLREAVVAEAERIEARHEQAAAQRFARQGALAQARAENRAAKWARLASSREGCGTPKSTGLCAVSGNWRVTEQQLREAALTVAATHVTMDDHLDVNAVIAHAEAGIRAEAEGACAQARAEGATDNTLALLARLSAETAVSKYRRLALATLARSDCADAEAALVYEAKMRSWRRYVTRSGARRAANAAAEQARERIAQHLLDTRLAALRQGRSVAAEGGRTVRAGSGVRWA